MPMIDVYATTGTFANKHQLTQDLAKAVVRWEGVPEIPLFLNNTAAFIHELPPDTISNAAGDSTYIRVQVLTPVNVLDRDKQLGVVKEQIPRRYVTCSWWAVDRLDSRPQSTAHRKA